MRGSSGGSLSTVSDVTVIKSPISSPPCCPRSAIFPVDGTELISIPTGPKRLGAGRQRQPSILVPFANRQGVGFRSCSNGTRYQPRALEPEPQGFPVDRGDDLQRDQRQRDERAKQRGARQRAAAAVEGGGKKGTFAVGFQDAQPHGVGRWQDAEMIAHRHLDKGRD